jgi:hypothetical protein
LGNRRRSTPPHPSPCRHRGRWQARLTLAQRWLLGELEREVDVPLEWVCLALHLEPAALASVVRRNLG